MLQTIEGQEQPYVPNWSTDDVLAYQRDRAEQERRVQTEQAALRHIDKRAKDSGLPIEVIKAVIKLRKREKTEAEVWINQFLRIGTANGIVGPQMNIFGQEGFTPTDEQAHMVAVAMAEDAGFRAGRGGLGKDSNPYTPGSEESQAWVKWWARGVEAAKFANGGVAPSPANKAQPKARGRRAVEVKAIPAPEETVEIQEAAPVAEPEPAVLEPEPPAVAKRKPGRPPKAKANGAGKADNVVAMPKKKVGRPAGSKNKPKPTRPAA